jgi:hypothetical protein
MSRAPSRELSSKDGGTAPSGIDFYRIVRAQLEHEDNLVTNRTSWFLTSQSFLFSAYAIIANGYVSTPRAAAPISSLTTAAGSAGDPRRLLLVIIPGVSVIVCVLTLISIMSGVAALHTLRQFYDDSDLRCAGETLPPVQGYRSTRLAGVAAPLLLPILFMGVWVFLLVRRLF